MKRHIAIVALLIATFALLSGCVVSEPRHRYYRDYGYREAPPPRDYRDERDYSQRDRYPCGGCGEIREIDHVRVRQGTTGGGAVLGAIIGGALGNLVGKGDGRKAATIAGAVAGGFAGNSVERNENGGDGDAWRFGVKLDDGRWAEVTQYDNPDFRRGDRVAIRGDHLVPLR